MQLSPRFDSALAFASELHRTQERKSLGVPYTSHLLAVTALVLENGGDEDTAIAALLHDAFEDQWTNRISWYADDDWDRVAIKVWGTLEEKVRHCWGDRVADIVNELTEERFPPGAEKPSWRERKLKYLEHLATASPEALLIAAADKLHNATCTLNEFYKHGDKCWDVLKAGKKSQEWWYTSCLEILRDRLGLAHPLVGNLWCVLDDLFTNPIKAYVERIQELEAENERLNEELAAIQDRWPRPSDYQVGDVFDRGLNWECEIFKTEYDAIHEKLWYWLRWKANDLTEPRDAYDLDRWIETGVTWTPVGSLEASS